MSPSEIQVGPTLASDSTESPAPDLPQAPLREPAAPPRPRRGLHWLIALLFTLSAVLASPLLLEQAQYAITRGQQRAKADVARAELADLEEPNSARFRLVAQSIEPSVVHIDSFRGSVDSPSSVFELPFALGGPDADWQESGTGSGVIIDREGYILTNFHVVDGAERIDVRLADGRVIREAALVGDDPLTDLALLKIEAGGLTPAVWGDSRGLEVGDWVMAVGNPFGLDGTATVGIVSAKQRRDIIGASAFQDFLQTDAAVNPGNSGGPLVDNRGRLVGITTAIVGRSFRGISFAIPSEIAERVADELRAQGRVPRAWLGVELADDPVYPAGFDEDDFDAPRGALVRGTVEGAPAQQAGIRRGDRILRFNEHEIANRSDLSRTVAQSKIGSAATITLMRDGQRRELTVQLRERPQETPRPAKAK